MSSFDYFSPKTLEEAVQLYNEHSASARLLLGGTDLVNMINDEMIKTNAVIDLKNIAYLKQLELKDNHLYIGADVTFTELIESDIIREKFPVIWESSRKVASMGIRNRATIVGNICSSVPSADSAPALLIRETIVRVMSVNGKREIDIADFFIGPRKNALKENEIVINLKIPVLNKSFGGSYVKMGRYKGEDLAQVGVATLVTEDLQYRIAYCAVSPKPIRIKKAEQLLNGREFSVEFLKDVDTEIMNAISPIGDIRASKSYREKMSSVLLEKSLIASYSRLKGNKPEYGKELL